MWGGWWCVSGGRGGTGNILLYAIGMFVVRYVHFEVCVGSSHHCHAPRLPNAHDKRTTESALHILRGRAGGFYFLDIRLSFLANFLHQVHLYKYILYLCFGFVFVFFFSRFFFCFTMHFIW